MLKDKYVNLSQALEELDGYPCQKYNDVVVIRNFKKYISELPAAENIREIRYSKWVFIEGRKFVCSCCDKSNTNMTPYCPNCGCEMKIDES